MAQDKFFDLIKEEKEQGVVIRVSGIFNSTSTPEIKPVLLQSADENNILLDLSEVSMLTSAGVGALFELADATSRSGRGFVIINPSDRVKQVINLTGFNEMFQFARNIDEALSAVSK